MALGKRARSWTIASSVRHRRRSDRLSLTDWLVAGPVGLLVLFFATMPMARRHHCRLARKRRRIDAAGFERGMAAVGVTATTSRFLWGELEALYYKPLRPMPDDHLESQIWIDRPEVEAVVLRFWSAMRGHDLRPVSVPLGSDPTVAELGRHCDLMAGWSPRGTA